MPFTWNQFTSLAVSEAQRHIRNRDPRNNDEFVQAFENELFDLPGPRKVVKNMTRDELYFRVFYNEFGEINSCTERLRDIEIYIGSFPYRSDNLDRIRNLRYHIENYFHEIYILRERLKAFLTKIGRKFTRDLRHEAILTTTRPLFGLIRGALGDVSNTRSGHVHQARFDSQDISRLDTLALLCRVDDLDQVMSGYLDVEYRRIRGEWKKKLKDNNEAVDALLDLLANALTPAFFDTTRNRLKYPRPRAN